MQIRRLQKWSQAIIEALLQLGCRSPATLAKTRDEKRTPTEVDARPGSHTCDLAKAAGIHYNTVNSFETERYAGRPETIAAMRKALEKAGVQFLTGGVKLKRSLISPTVSPTLRKG